MEDKNKETLYSVNQVVDILQVNNETVYRWIAQGKLKAQRFGKLWRIPESSLNEFGNKV